MEINELQLFKEDYTSITIEQFYENYTNNGKFDYYCYFPITKNIGIYHDVLMKFEHKDYTSYRFNASGNYYRTYDPTDELPRFIDKGSRVDIYRKVDLIIYLMDQITIISNKIKGLLD